MEFSVLFWVTHGVSELCCYRAAGRPGGLAARNTTEQHPFHLHGHHFWVLGSGVGPYNGSVEATLNVVNPMYRDTQIVPQSGWTVIRFVVSPQLTRPSTVSA